MKYPLILLLIFTYSCKVQLLEPERTYYTNYNNVVEKKVKKNHVVLYFIKHVEPNDNKQTNPKLSLKGVKRLKLYTKYFADKKVDTVYTTNLNRTIETATAIADCKKATLVFYDPFTTDVKLFDNYKNNAAVIVGHSNTTPEFVNKFLKRHKYSQMLEEDYSSIYRVVIDNGKIISDVILNLENEIQKIDDSKLSPDELKKVLKAREKAKRQLVNN